ncbi:hypothetical protein [Absidia glauca]|uniref:Uncharacterized protein n=1 Tax=Absidia glauca TaxID=4829 RepID=A0A168MPS3_ABSGL|nr:hypothetical protein [Absidia glauca]
MISLKDDQSGHVSAVDLSIVPSLDSPITFPPVDTAQVLERFDPVVLKLDARLQAHSKIECLVFWSLPRNLYLPPGILRSKYSNSDFGKWPDHPL